MHLGIDAQPLHVAMGLEMDVEEPAEDARFLVTFEGSARGLHLDNVDAVFIMGRPASAASYLHLAGRVGRLYPNDSGGVVIRPGTVVSVCTKGRCHRVGKVDQTDWWNGSGRNSSRTIENDMDEGTKHRVKSS